MRKTAAYGPVWTLHSNAVFIRTSPAQATPPILPQRRGASSSAPGEGQTVILPTVPSQTQEWDDTVTVTPGLIVDFTKGSV